MGASSKVVIIPRDPAALPSHKLTDVELADQFGEMHRQVKKFKPTADRCDDLRREIETRCTDRKADQTIFLTGRIWRAEASPKQFTTSLPPLDKLHRMFRAAKKDFYSACTITLKAIREQLGNETLERISMKEQNGLRIVTAVLLDPPPAA